MTIIKRSMTSTAARERQATKRKKALSFVSANVVIAAAVIVVVALLLVCLALYQSILTTTTTTLSTFPDFSPFLLVLPQQDRIKRQPLYHSKNTKDAQHPHRFYITNNSNTSRSTKNDHRPIASAHRQNSNSVTNNNQMTSTSQLQNRNFSWSSNEKKMVPFVQQSPQSPPFEPSGTIVLISCGNGGDHDNGKNYYEYRYKGILHISRAFKRAATATFFFHSIVDALLYAREFQLYPMIWIDQVDWESQPCYDKVVHGTNITHVVHSVTRRTIPSNNRTFTTTRTVNGETQKILKCASEPGPPQFQSSSLTYNSRLELRGNGVWQSYFQPPVLGMPLIPSSLFWGGDDKHQMSSSLSSSSSCSIRWPPQQPQQQPQPRLPMFELSQSQLFPGMHYCSPLAVRGWVYKGLDPALHPDQLFHNDANESNTNTSQPRRPLQQWLGQHRQRASQMVKRHFRLQPWLETRVQDNSNTMVRQYREQQERQQRQEEVIVAAANLNTTTVTSTKVTTRQPQCLAVHVRLTDKGNGRPRQGMAAYWSYIKAYIQAVHSCQRQDAKKHGTTTTTTTSTPSALVYVASDDARVLGALVNASQKTWAHHDQSMATFYAQPNTLLSHNQTSTFTAFATQHHRINTETLVDIYTMARACTFVVHGFSAVAEAVFYIHPKLHDSSINMDDPDEIKPKEFQRLVEERTCWSPSSSSS